MDSREKYPGCVRRIWGNSSTYCCWIFSAPWISSLVCSTFVFTFFCNVCCCYNLSAARTSPGSHSTWAVSTHQPHLRFVPRGLLVESHLAALWEPAVPAVSPGPGQRPLRRSLSGNESCLTSMPSPNHLILCLWLMFACLSVQTTAVSKAKLFMT